MTLVNITLKKHYSWHFEKDTDLSHNNGVKYQTESRSERSRHIKVLYCVPVNQWNRLLGDSTKAESRYICFKPTLQIANLFNQYKNNEYFTTFFK